MVGEGRNKPDAGSPAGSGPKQRREHVIECPCGTILREVDIPSVVVAAQQHALAVHDLELSDEQAGSMARPA